MKSNAVRFGALLVFLTLEIAVAHAAERGSPRLLEEIEKQESIYRSKGEQVPAGYTVDRSLLAYTQALSSEFDRALGMLTPWDRWLDIGAGEGRAILDYYTPKFDMLHFEGREKRGDKAQSVAISIEDRRTPQWQEKAASLPANKIQYLVNRRLREYSLQELGRFRLITDVIGGFSYTTNLSLFMEMALGLLELNGSFFSVLADVDSQEGANKPFYEGAPYLTELVKADGSKVKVCSWLKSITCVKVTCEFKANWRPPIEAFQVQKVCNDVNVPALLPGHFEAGTPPERSFKLAN